MSDKRLGYGRNLIVVFTSLFLAGGSCSCKDQAGFQIVRGTLSERECEERLKAAGVDSDDPPNASVECPGAPMTMCYGKAGIDEIRITSDDGSIDSTVSSDVGVIHFVADKTKTITLEPLDSCAGSVEGTVHVLIEATDVPFTGSWDKNLIGANNCSNVVFNVSDTFVSPDIFAIEAKADWDDDKLQEAYLGDGECPTPPFLSVFREGDIGLGQHSMPVPQQWEKMPRDWETVGNWSFVPEYINECGARKNCDLRTDFPFALYLSCDRDEPYRQP